MLQLANDHIILQALCDAFPELLTWERVVSGSNTITGEILTFKWYLSVWDTHVTIRGFDVKYQPWGGRVRFSCDYYHRLELSDPNLLNKIQNILHLKVL